MLAEAAFHRSCSAVLLGSLGPRIAGAWRAPVEAEFWSAFETRL